MAASTFTAESQPASTPERNYAVAVSDGSDLFLWIRLRRASGGDIYYIFPHGRAGREEKSWNPHGSLHRDGNLHHKAYACRMGKRGVQMPDASFQGSLHFIQRPTASSEPRGFGVVCDPSDFDEVMEISINALSEKRYGTSIYIDLTDAGGILSINTTTGGKIVAQHFFRDALPWIIVSLVAHESQ